MFGTRIKELRKENAMSQTILAQKIGCNQSMIARWESLQCEPTESVIRKTALIFNVTSDYLLGLEDEYGVKSMQEEFTYFDGTHYISKKGR